MQKRFPRSIVAVVALMALSCGSNTPAAPDDTEEDASTQQDAGGPDAQQQQDAQQQDVQAEDVQAHDVDPGLDAPQHASYPPGPYGWTGPNPAKGTPGSVIANQRWLGWRDPVAAGYDPNKRDIIQLSDYYDPEGKKYKAIFLNASARWCSACRYEQTEIKKWKDKWADKGGVFLETLFENSTGGPPTFTDLKWWGEANKITWTMLLDPGNKLSPMFDKQATPMNAIIDPRTMRIVVVTTGVPDAAWWEKYMKPLIEK